MNIQVNGNLSTSATRILIATGSFILTFLFVWTLLTVLFFWGVRKKIQTETEQVHGFSTWMMLRPNGLWSSPSEWPGTNEDGFRIKEYGKEKSPGEWRVAVLGGSTVYGTGVTPFQTIPRTLQTICQQQGHSKIKVLNFGMSGYTSTNELVLLVTYVMQYNPDMVIIFDGWNDNCTRNYLPHLGPFAAIYKNVLDDANAHTSTYSMAVQMVLGASPIGQALAPLILTRPAVDESNLQIRAAVKDTKRSIMTNVDTAEQTYSQNLRAMDGILASFGVSHFFVLQPIDHMPVDYKRTKRSVDLYSAFSAAFLSACSHITSPCYDASNVLEELHGNRRYYQDTVHLTPEGTKLIATVLFDLLREMGHVKGTPLLSAIKVSRNLWPSQIFLSGSVSTPYDFSKIQLVFRTPDLPTKS